LAGSSQLKWSKGQVLGQFNIRRGHGRDTKGKNLIKNPTWPRERWESTPSPCLPYVPLDILETAPAGGPKKLGLVPENDGPTAELAWAWVAKNRI
jgi:hypothetical protein